VSKTALQIVNSTLVRLREPSISNFSSDYSKLILEYLNDTIDEMNQRHYWRALTDETQFTTVDAQLDYNLTANVTGGGDVLDSSNVWTPDTKLLFHTAQGQEWASPTPRHGRQVAIAFDITDSPSNHQMVFAGSDEVGRFRWNKQGRNDVSSSSIQTVFWIDRDKDSDVVNFKYFHNPGAGRSIIMQCYYPQADVTTTTDILYLPARGVILGTYAKALEERGEELGPQGQQPEFKYQKALDDAILRDMDEDTIIAIPE
jgi:hypothetical protein